MSDDMPDEDDMLPDDDDMLPDEDIGLDVVIAELMALVAAALAPELTLLAAVVASLPQAASRARLAALTATMSPRVLDMENLSDGSEGARKHNLDCGKLPFGYDSEELPLDHQDH